MKSDAKQTDQYIVEKIVARCQADSSITYLIKWEGYPESQNTWEPIEHLEGCQELLDEFEKSLLGTKTSEVAPGSVAEASGKDTNHQPDNEPETDVEDDDFDLLDDAVIWQGGEPEYILGATTSTPNSMAFLVKVKNVNRNVLVRSVTMNSYWPQIVIKYLEKVSVFV